MTDSPLMLVRLRSRQPDGVMVGQRQRSCHVVPVPDAAEILAFLTAYCGLQIAPGSAEIVLSPGGMPCESCLARSPVPAFTLLRRFRGRIGGSDADL